MKQTKKSTAVLLSFIIAIQAFAPVAVFAQTDEVNSVQQTEEQAVDEAAAQDISDISEEDAAEYTEEHTESMTYEEFTEEYSEEESFVYVGDQIMEDEENIPLEAEAQIETTTADAYTMDTLYLSDLNKGELVKASIGYSTLKYNGNMNGNEISLYVDGKKTYFKKGLTAHAQSELIYDVSKLVSDYGYNSFSTYLGIDSVSGGNGDGVLFYVYASSTGMDNDDWVLVKDTGVLKGSSNCQYLIMDIRDIKYLRFVFDMNTHNGNDHSVLADAKLMKDVYDRKFQNYEFIKTVEEYDKEIENYGKAYESLASNKEYISLLQQRIIVEKAGYRHLQDIANRSDDYEKAMRWFFSDEDIINMFINGGPPRGNNYLQTVKIVLDIYIKHSEDMSDPLYRRMMIAAALTNSERLGTWYGLDTTCEPVKRYEIYKHLHEKKYLVDNVFENLNVPEMRYVFEDTISDEEIEWLNFYHRKYKLHNMHPDITEFNVNKTGPGPYQYITYGFGYDYDKDIYYSEENRKQWEDKYHFVKRDNDSDDDDFDFNVPYNEGRRLWIVFNEGSVCGGIAQTGAHILTVNGMPAHHIGQPGHAAYIYYNYYGDATQPEGAPGIWKLGNDVGGWTKSYTYNAYLPLNWGHQPWRNTYNITYIFLIQAALNEFDKYEEAETYVRVADYLKEKGNYEDAIEIYNKAIEVQSIDYNAWIGLYDTYVAKNASDEEYAELARKAAETLTYYPTPMYDYIATAIKPRMTDSVLISDVNVYLTNALIKASNATADDTLQFNECKLVAKYTLGAYDTSIADFSFDGEKAGTIVLSDEFAQGGNRFLYSLDGANTWIDAGDDKEGKPNTEKKLTADELKQITAENDICVRLQGTNNYYTIDILPTEPPSKIFCNDKENCLLQIPENCEYSVDNGENWADLRENIDFLGNVKVLARIKARGKSLQSDSYTYWFTADSDDETLSYISIKRISAIDCSSEDTAHSQYAANTIDGNINTVWHTNWGGGDNDRYITYEFDTPVFLSAIDYTPSQTGGNGRFMSCEIYTSTDKQNWVLAGSAGGWATDTQTKRIELSMPYEAKYVKVVGKKAVGNFGSAAMIEFYEDLTCRGKELMCIFMLPGPDKVNYVVGDTLDTTGMMVYAMYTDNSMGKINLSSLNFSKTVFDTVGKEIIEITYPGFVNTDMPGLDKIELEVNVAANTKHPVSLNVDKLPEKTRYFVGETLDTKGLAVTATYEDGTTGYVFDYDVENIILDSDGIKPVNVTWNGLSASFDVDVIKEVKKLEVSDRPDKMQYMVGEPFDSAGMEVTAIFADETGAVLEPDRYIVNSDDFSIFSGNRLVNIMLDIKNDISTDLSVTVLPNVTDGYLKFDISEDGYTCYVSGYETESIPHEVVIPDKIIVNGAEYTVIGISSEAFDNAPINSIDMPGTIIDIQSNAFRNCYDIKEVYFIDHTSVDALTVAADAFEYNLEENDAYIYVSDLGLKDDLLAKEGIKGKFEILGFAGKITKIDVIPPVRTGYNIGDDLDLTGFGVYADLSGNGQMTLLSPHNYELKWDRARCGRIPVTIDVYDTEVSGSFDINVSAAKPIITTQPVSALYGSKEIIHPLTVEAYTTDKGIISYQWYRRIGDHIDPYEDIKLEGETNNEFIPKETGNYYVVVTNSDGVNFDSGSYPVVSNVASVTIGGYVASIKTVGYNSIQEAVNAARSLGDTIYINEDVILEEPVVIENKEIVIASKGMHAADAGEESLPDVVNEVHTIKRGENLKDRPMFIHTAKTNVLNRITFENIILDGGAEWTGTDDDILCRGNTNTGIRSEKPVLDIRLSAEVVLADGTIVCNNDNHGAYADAGGAVRLSDSANIFIDGAEIRNNYSEYGGAVMSINNSTVNFERGTVSGNYAKQSGGAFCIGDVSNLNIKDGVVENNASALDSPIYLKDGNIKIDGGIIRNNGGQKGSIYVASTADNKGVLTFMHGIIEKTAALSDVSSYCIYIDRGSLISGYTDNLTGPVYLNSGSKIKFIGSTSGKELFVELGGTWNDGSELADVSEVEIPAFAKQDKNSLRVKAGNSSKLAYTSPSDSGKILIKTADLDYDTDKDGYVTNTDAVKLLMKTAEIPVDIEYADINKDSNNDILDVTDLMQYLEGR